MGIADKIADVVLIVLLVGERRSDRTAPAAGDPRFARAAPGTVTIRFRRSRLCTDRGYSIERVAPMNTCRSHDVTGFSAPTGSWVAGRGRGSHCPVIPDEQQFACELRGWLPRLPRSGSASGVGVHAVMDEGDFLHGRLEIYRAQREFRVGRRSSPGTSPIVVLDVVASAGQAVNPTWGIQADAGRAAQTRPSSRSGVASGDPRPSPAQQEHTAEGHPNDEQRRRRRDREDRAAPPEECAEPHPRTHPEERAAEGGHLHLR